MITAHLDGVTATAGDLATFYSVPVGTVYRWASVDAWRRTNYAYPVRYNWADADASFHRYRTTT